MNNDERKLFRKHVKQAFENNITEILDSENLTIAEARDINSRIQTIIDKCFDGWDYARASRTQRIVDIMDDEVWISIADQLLQEDWKNTITVSDPRAWAQAICRHIFQVNLHGENALQYVFSMYDALEDIIGALVDTTGDSWKPNGDRHINRFRDFPDKEFYLVYLLNEEYVKYGKHPDCYEATQLGVDVYYLLHKLNLETWE